MLCVRVVCCAVLSELLLQLGYYGYREQQALRAALLQRQQELEQSESGCH